MARNESSFLIEPFKSWVTCGRPWITVKLATSLDGAIADRQGRSRWISGPAAGRWVDQLRSEVDAVMVGSGTAMKDNPSLVPRNGRRPTAHRVVVDSRGRIPVGSRLLRDEWSALSVVALGPEVPDATRAAMEKHGAVTWALRQKAGHVSLKDLAQRMGREGWLHVLCEGGGGLAAALLRAGLVDELAMVVAPVVIGGRKAMPAFGEPGWVLRSAPRFKRVEQRELGDDMLLRLRPEVG